MGGPYGRPESSLNAIKSSFSLLWDYLSSLLTRSVARSALQARIPRDYLSSLLTRSVARSALQARIPKYYSFAPLEHVHSNMKLHNNIPRLDK
jgi:hypothetical protein